MAKEFTSAERDVWLKSLHASPGGASMLIENPSGHLLIVKANYKQRWTPPGGVIDKGESPKQAALRETKEEVGLAINPAEVQFVGVIYKKGHTIDTYQFVFKALIDQVLSETITLQESEIEGYAFVSKEQVKTDDRVYGLIIKDWASGHTIPSYDEQDYEA